MPDDVVRELAWALAREVAFIRADHDPDDAVVLVAALLDEAKRDPLGWLQSTGKAKAPVAAQPERAGVPDAAEVYRRRAQQVGR